MADHAPEMTAIDLTMSQAKALYLIIAAGELRMSDLAARLGVTSSTATGLVDRLVELELLARHEDPADRRQVVVAPTAKAERPLEHFRELNSRRMREMLERVGDRRPAGRRARPPGPRCGAARARPQPTHRSIHRHHHRRGEPFVSRLSELAVAKRSVTLLLAAALFVAGVSAWGSLKQELLPDIEFPVITVIAPFPGAGSEDVAEQVAVPDRAGHLRRRRGWRPSSPRRPTRSPWSIAQFAYGTDVKEATDGHRGGHRRRPACRTPSSPTVSALNINACPVIIASIAATSEDGLEAAADIARTEIVPEIAAIEGVSRADVTGGLETRLLVTLDPGRPRRDRASRSPRSPAS